MKYAAPVLSVQDVREILKDHRTEKIKKSMSEAAARFIDRRKWEYQTKHKLELVVPKGGKYKVTRKMARLFDREINIENYKLAQCLKYKLINNKKLNKRDYEFGKTKYDEKIRNHLKVLNRFLKPINRVARYRRLSSRIVLLKSVVRDGKNSLNITPKK